MCLCARVWEYEGRRKLLTLSLALRPQQPPRDASEDLPCKRCCCCCALQHLPNASSCPSRTSCFAHTRTHSLTEARDAASIAVLLLRCAVMTEKERGIKTSLQKGFSKSVLREIHFPSESAALVLRFKLGCSSRQNHWSNSCILHTHTLTSLVSQQMLEIDL